MVRGVVFPYTRGGVAAAMILGLGRAIGEAIAVALVIGAASRDQREHLRQRQHARAHGSPSQFQGAPSALELSSLIYSR